MRSMWAGLSLILCFGCGGGSSGTPTTASEPGVAEGGELETTPEATTPESSTPEPPLPDVPPTQLAQADFPADHEACRQVFPIATDEGIELHMPRQIVVDRSQTYGLCAVAGDIPMCIGFRVNAWRATQAPPGYVVFIGDDGVEHRGQPGECDPSPIIEDPSPGPGPSRELLEDLLTGGTHRVNALESMEEAVDVGPGHYRVQVVRHGYRSNIVEVDVSFAP